MACGDRFHFAGQIVIPQDITQFMALFIFTHCRGLMCLGSIAAFSHIQICYHGIIRIGYRSRMTPGVLCI